MKPKKKEVNTRPKASSIKLERDPMPNKALTPLEEFNYSPEKNTYDALRYLSSWYNSNQYAGMEHDRGRDNSIPGRHILQTAYGRSRMGNRNEPYERAVEIAYSPRVNTRSTDLPSATYGTYDPKNQSVSINKYAQDQQSALVHELYHAAEGALGAFIKDSEGKSRMPAVDRRFADMEPTSYHFVFSDDLRPFQNSNPYTAQEWSDRMFGDEYTSEMQRYVSEPAEVTARLRQVAFEAQRAGLLPQGDFRLTDEILEQLKDNPSAAAEQLLRYLTPEQREKFYQAL